MTRTRLSHAHTHTARRLAREGVAIMRIATVINKPYADVFAAVRGVDYPHPVLGEPPVPSPTSGGDPRP